MKGKRIAVSVALLLSASANAEELKTTERKMSFEKCIAVRESTVTSLNIPPQDIIPLVNTAIMTVTRLCLKNGSILFTCSKPDEKMILVQSPHLTGCP